MSSLSVELASEILLCIGHPPFNFLFINSLISIILQTIYPASHFSIKIPTTNFYYPTTYSFKLANLLLYYQQQNFKMSQVIQTKYCSHCRATLPLFEFRHRTRPNVSCQICYSCRTSAGTAIAAKRQKIRAEDDHRQQQPEPLINRPLNGA